MSIGDTGRAEQMREMPLILDTLNSRLNRMGDSIRNLDIMLGRLSGGRPPQMESKAVKATDAFTLVESYHNHDQHLVECLAELEEIIAELEKII